MWRFRTPKLQDADSEAEAALISRLQALMASPDPQRAGEGRARLLSEVASRRNSSPQSSQRTPVLDLLLGRKRLALAAIAVVALGAAGAVGASGGVNDSAGNVGAVLDALHITDRTPDQADSHIEDAGGAGTNSPDGNADDNASEGSGNSDDGINNSNAADEGLENADDNASEGSGNAEDGAANGDDHATDPPQGPAPALPTQANDHASDGAGNASDNVPDDAGPPAP